MSDVPLARSSINTADWLVYTPHVFKRLLSHPGNHLEKLPPVRYNPHSDAGSVQQTLCRVRPRRSCHRWPSGALCIKSSSLCFARQSGMKIFCPCGEMIYDGGHTQPDKARFVTSQSSNDFLESLKTEEVSWRKLFGLLNRDLFQCGACGRLFVQGR